MVDFHLSVVFGTLDCEEHYLRIQEDTLTGTESSVDVATEENLNRLVEIGEKLLKKPVSRVNLETGFTEPVNNGGKNEDALKKYGGNQTIFFEIPVRSWLPKIMEKTMIQGLIFKIISKDTI
ncbi:unnamed protein product [Ilex paraguariensis]|uniref:Uncharacterized protein n=1 Tax=Ilex paraguariensis TaxID=185542 RepID=A0ABC8TP84_9AQUA